MKTRIWIDLSGGPAALDCALELARRLGGELSGLYVEDARVLRSAALPFVRQVSLVTSADEDFDAPRTERELRLAAARARAELERRAALARVVCSFRVVRGDPLRALAEAAAAAAELADIAVVAGARRRGEPALARGAVLYLRSRPRLDLPLVVAPASEPASERALQVAATLAAAGLSVVALLPLSDSARAAGLERLARAAAPHVRRLPAATAGALAGHLRTLSAPFEILLVPGLLDPLLEPLDLPTLLVGAPA